MGNGPLNGTGAGEHVVDGFALADVQAQGEAQVALGVQIDAQNPRAPLLQAADQSGNGGGFAHAALLIRDSDDLCQRIFLLTVKTKRGPLIFIILYVDKKT